ncbi:hypothetical protein TWF718_004797 [Orbilia javanica]|uniref:Uncharacterized protein n=1 Tax=Orbilia javanica TaxID=47235 RepID=A0AAN8N6J8_9PEZI
MGTNSIIHHRCIAILSSIKFEPQHHTPSNKLASTSKQHPEPSSMDEDPNPENTSSPIPGSDTLPTGTRELYQTRPNQPNDCDDRDGSTVDNDNTAIHPQPSVPQKASLSVDTSGDRRCTSSPNTGVPSLAAPPQLTRASSFRNSNLPQFLVENDQFGHILGRSLSSSSGQNYVPSNSSMTALRTFSCTPTTENLARRMAHSGSSSHTTNLSVSSLDTEPYFHQMTTSQRPTSSGDGPPEGQNQQGSDGAHNPPTGTKSIANPNAHPLNTTREDAPVTKAGLVSYLPRIPAASTTASEKERVAKWGPEIGPPTDGSTYRNPYHYEILDAYSEQVDHPMFNVAESTRRAGNAAIQTMFDPLYALPGLDGQIPRGFPLYGFSMREMPTAILHEVLRAYGIEPIEGIGYEADRQNMSLLCGHIGATWLSGVI